MTVTETPATPIQRPGDAATKTSASNFGMRVAVWAGLAAVGVFFWLGVWKAIELVF